MLPGGLADKAGLKRGDVILEGTKKQVESAKELQEAVSRSCKGRKLLFLVNRKGSTFFVTAGTR